MSLSLSLYRLQQVDNRIKQTTTRLNIIQEKLNDNAELRLANQKLNSAKNSLDSIQASLKKVEEDSTNLRIKCELAEASLYAGHIKSPKELQELQVELSIFKRNLSTLEDQQLTLMGDLEESQDKLALSQKECDSVQGKVIGENASLLTELVSLKKDLENLDAQRQAVLPTIDALNLNFYDSLRQKKSGLAVSLIIDNACSVCGSDLTPGMAQAVRNLAKITLCPMCGRILYSN